MRIKVCLLLSNFLLLSLICPGIGNTSLYAQFNFSQGLYRVPYEDDVDIEASNDIWNHTPPGKYDFVTGTGDPLIVAAAGGWVRAIEEDFDIECHENGNGEPCCWWYNNFVILEHPNGEWSGYTHMQYGSSSAAGLELNEWVDAGDVLGIEGSVGCSTGPHLHFEVTRPDTNAGNPFDPVGGFLAGEKLIPVICGNIPDLAYFIEGETYTAGPCVDICPPVLEATGNVAGDGHFVVRAGQAISTDDIVPVHYLSGSKIQFRSGGQISLLPGLHIHAGAVFQGRIKGCNEQN